MRQAAIDAVFFSPLLDLARQAGLAILAVRDHSRPVEVRFKEDDSPLTEADLAAHRILVSGLRALMPQRPVVSEESGHGDPRHGASSFWLIDPLDGTKEFLNHSGEFTVNIALIEQGRPVLGIVHAPALDLTYWGQAGGKAWRCRSGQCDEIRVSPMSADPLRIVASKSHLNQATADFIAGLGEHVLVQAGSSLKFCRIAEGAADVYPRLAPTSEWDTAAAQAVLEAAGGHVFQPDGRPLAYGKADILNPPFIASAISAKALERLRNGTRHP